MLRFVISPSAEHDLLSILSWTHDQFGEQVRLRYEALLEQAILDVATDCNCTGVEQRNEIQAGCYTYHLWHSRTHVDRTLGRIKRPRHFLLFRVVGDVLEIGRILHDSMELNSHLPQGFGSTEIDSP